MKTGIPALRYLSSRRSRRRLAAAAIVTAFVAWRLALRAAELGRLGDLSSHLGFPLAWLAWFLAAASVVAVLVFAGLARRAARAGAD